MMRIAGLWKMCNEYKGLSEVLSFPPKCIYSGRPALNFFGFMGGWRVSDELKMKHERIKLVGNSARSPSRCQHGLECVHHVLAHLSTMYPVCTPSQEGNWLSGEYRLRWVRGFNAPATVWGILTPALYRWARAIPFQSLAQAIVW
jgi:hypothetical protein